jgi:secreted PhoX family phosphatase
MNELKLTNNQSLYTAHKQEPGSLTKNDIGNILRWAEAHNLSRTDTAKLILFFQAKKKAAYAKKKK